MDGGAVSQADYAACMADLAKVNTVTLARLPTLAFLDRIAGHLPADHRLTILDVGFGDGDMLRAIHRWARRRGRLVRLVGIDINPRSAPVANATTPADWGIDYRTGDAMILPAQERIDVVLSSLVTHHMDDAEIARFLAWMEERALLGWFVNDLHRHVIAYHGFKLLAWAFRWHYFVQHDGAVSVARSFRRKDWRELIRSSGLIGVAPRVRWRFPFRLCVSRIR